MNTDQILTEAFFILDNKVPQSTFTDLASTIVDSLVDKYNKSTVAYYASSEEDSDINNVLTHIIELGSLKCLYDSKLISADENLADKVFASVYIMNHTLAKVLSSKGLFSLSSDCYFGGAGLETIASRTFDHCKTHLIYSRLSEKEREDIFSIDEMFAFYLGDFYKRAPSSFININQHAIVSTTNKGNIETEKVYFDTIQGWSGCHFRITNDFISISKGGSPIFESKLLLQDVDDVCSTYVGNFGQFQKFRLITPSAVASLLIKARGDNEIFSIGSMLPNGFSVTFEY